jgi:putative peptide zinc metalloprotease protein
VPRLLAYLLATLIALGGLAPAAALAQSGDTNAAQAVNTEDGSSLFDFAFKIRRVAGDTVDQTNVAVAYANCESCQTVAVAIQIVLVTTDPKVVTPTNVAVAVNEECTTCSTLAAAYQFVYGNGGPVRFTPEGRKRINDARKTLGELKKDFEDGSLTTDEVRAEITRLTDEVRDILKTELVPVGRGRDDGDEKGKEEGDAEAPTPGGARDGGERLEPLPGTEEDPDPGRTRTTPESSPDTTPSTTTPRTPSPPEDGGEATTTPETQPAPAPTSP